MSWAITLYPNYGTIDFLYNKLRQRWKTVEITEEFDPYHHYHAYVKDVYGKNDKYENHLKWLNRIKHTKAPHKVYLSSVDDTKKYIDYIRKERNRRLSNIDTEKGIVNHILIEKSIMEFMQVNETGTEKPSDEVSSRSVSKEETSIDGRHQIGNSYLSG